MVCVCVSSESRLHVCGQRGRQILCHHLPVLAFLDQLLPFPLQSVLSSDVNLSTRVHII